MRPVPYIGVSGFMNVAEVRSALIAFGGTCSARRRRLMIGVLASSKTLAGQKNRYPNRYPDVDTIANLFYDHPFALNLIHYATDEPSTLSAQLERIVALGGPHLHGVQLNVAWPPVEDIVCLRGMRVVLQLGRKTLADATNGDISTVIDGLATYDGIVTDVLIDASGGTGVPMDPDLALHFAGAIAHTFPRLGIGVAGGLSGPTSELVRPVAECCPFINIDAEGRLRTDDDRLDIPAMNDYLNATSHILG